MSTRSALCGVNGCPNELREIHNGEGYCFQHGTRIIGEPMGIPDRAESRLKNACVDCQHPIYDTATRCRSCARKALRGDPRLSVTPKPSSEIVVSPLKHQPRSLA